jgi:hypothetical protein
MDEAGASPPVESPFREALLQGGELLRIQAGKENRYAWSGQPNGDLQNLLGGLSLSVDHLSQTLTEMAMVIQVGVGQLIVAERTVLQLLGSLLRGNAPIRHALHESLELFRRHDTPPPVW